MKGYHMFCVVFQAFLYVVVLDFVQVPCLKKRLRMNYVSIRTSVKDRVKKSLRQKKFHLTQNRAQWTENIWNIFFFNLLLRTSFSGISRTFCFHKCVLLSLTWGKLCIVNYIFSSAHLLWLSPDMLLLTFCWLSFIYLWNHLSCLLLM